MQTYFLFSGVIMQGIFPGSGITTEIRGVL